MVLNICKNIYDYWTIYGESKEYKEKKNFYTSFELVKCPHQQSVLSIYNAILSATTKKGYTKKCSKNSIEKSK